MPLDVQGAFDAVDRVASVDTAGRVLRVVGGVVEASGPRAAVGELCSIAMPTPAERLLRQRPCLPKPRIFANLV